MSSHDYVSSRHSWMSTRTVEGGTMILDHPVVPLLGRLMMTYIFATSGIGKVFGWSGNVAYMNTRHLPMIPVLLAIAMVIEVAGSVCLVTGYQARIAAFVMFWYTTVVTVIFPQLLGGERHDGGNAGDALSKKSGDHGRAADAGVQRAGKMGAEAAQQFLRKSGHQIGCRDAGPIPFYLRGRRNPCWK